MANVPKEGGYSLYAVLFHMYNVKKSVVPKNAVTIAKSLPCSF
jgi:hypothetical protein